MRSNASPGFTVAEQAIDVGPRSTRRGSAAVTDGFLGHCREPRSHLGRSAAAGRSAASGPVARLSSRSGFTATRGWSAVRWCGTARRPLIAGVLRHRISRAAAAAPRRRQLGPFQATSTATAAIVLSPGATGQRRADLQCRRPAAKPGGTIARSRARPRSTSRASDERRRSMLAFPAADAFALRVVPLQEQAGRRCAPACADPARRRRLGAADGLREHRQLLLARASARQKRDRDPRVDRRRPRPAAAAVPGGEPILAIAGGQPACWWRSPAFGARAR